MKKFTLAVATVLAIFGAAVSGCSKSEGSEAAVIPGDSTAINVRYVNLTNVLNEYTLAKELMAEQQRVANEFEAQSAAKENELQRMYQSIQQKAQNRVYLTQESAAADEQRFLSMQDQARQWVAQRQQQIVYQGMQMQMRLMDSIRTVVREISVANNIDAVLEDSSTLYISPRLDISDAVIAALNARYTSSAPAAQPAQAAAPAAAAQPAK